MPRERGTGVCFTRSAVSAAILCRITTPGESKPRSRRGARCRGSSRRPYAPAVELVVGVDMSTAEIRAVAADANGRIVASGRAQLPAPTGRRPGWSEQNASAWWPAVVAALWELGDIRSSVVAVTVCATSGTVVALDREGRPLAPALMYSDQRAVAEAEVAQEAGARRWARLGLRVQPTFGLPKWAWLLAEHPSTHRLAHASDVVVGDRGRRSGRSRPTGATPSRAATTRRTASGRARPWTPSGYRSGCCPRSAGRPSRRPRRRRGGGGHRAAGRMPGPAGHH